jgi:hypothetical protein
LTLGLEQALRREQQRGAAQRKRPEFLDRAVNLPARISFIFKSFLCLVRPIRRIRPIGPIKKILPL